jgi:hypothetical protein
MQASGRTERDEVHASFAMAEMNGGSGSGHESARLRTLIEAGWITQAIGVAAELGLAELLASGPRRVEELASITGSHAPSLQRLLRALESLDICAEGHDGFVLRPTGALLRADAEDSLRAYAILNGRQLWPVWEGLAYSVRTGKSHRELLTGMQGYARFQLDAEAATTFNTAMVEITRQVAHAIALQPEFPECVVDVGGGYGELLMAVLRSNGRTRGILYDLPHAIDRARERWNAPGLAERCTLLAGSFFESIPSGGDLYLMKSVLHNWDDERCAAILANCRQAMPRHAKLHLIERVMPALMRASPSHQTLARSDLNMLVGPGGKERTVAEYEALLESAGFCSTGMRELALEFSLIEAVGRD